MSKINQQLTDRELEVLRLASAGNKDWQVAKALEVSTSTVTTYWNRVKMKLSVRSRSEAVAIFAASQATPTDQWQEESDHFIQKAGSKQWSDMGAPFVFLTMDLSGRFIQGSGSVVKYVGKDGRPPTEDDWARFISQMIGDSGLHALYHKGSYSATLTINEMTFEVYALIGISSSQSGNTASVTVIDVTPHVELQKALSKERDHYKLILDEAPNMIFMWNFEKGNITYLNNYATHILGLSKERMMSLGWSVFDLIHSEDRDSANARLSQLSHMRKGEIQALPLRVRTTEGQYVEFNTVSTPLAVNSDGSVREFLCMCFEIGQFQRALEQIEKEHADLVSRYNSLSSFFRLFNHQPDDD